MRRAACAGVSTEPVRAGFSHTLSQKWNLCHCGAIDYNHIHARRNARAGAHGLRGRITASSVARIGNGDERIRVSGSFRESIMRTRWPITIAWLTACGICTGSVWAADGDGAAPCRAANAQSAPMPAIASPVLPGQGERAGVSGSTVRSFSNPGCAGAVLQGEHGSATVDGDRIELKSGTVYVNGESYGSVTPAQTVEYDVARGKRTLRVDGDVRIPAH